MISIRFYNDQDYLWLKETLQEWKLFDEVWETKENLKNKIDRDPESILVAQDNNTVIGCIFIMEDWRNAFMWRLAVKKQYRNKWIGKMLIGKAEKIIKSRWLKEVWGFVDDTNIELQKWYEKQNYIKTKKYKFIYKKLD